MSDSSKEILNAHLRAHAVLRGGPFTLRSGEVSDVYIDARRTFFDGEGAGLVGNVVADLVPVGVAAIGGMTMGADPISVATALVSAQRGRPLAAFSIRKKPKDHGIEGRLVGPVAAGDHVVAIEDTSTTGGAFIEAVAAMRDEDLVIDLAVCLIDRSGSTVSERMEAAGIPYLAVFTLEDLGIV